MIGGPLLHQAALTIIQPTRKGTTGMSSIHHQFSHCCCVVPARLRFRPLPDFRFLLLDSIAATSLNPRGARQWAAWEVGGTDRAHLSIALFLEVPDSLIPCALAGGGGGGAKVGLPALEVELAFPQATPASLFPPSGEDPLLAPTAFSSFVVVQL